MDNNKLRKLREINYELARVCYNCIHSKFKKGQSFGLCHTHLYEHKKHSEKQSFLSINMYGTCPRHALKKKMIDDFFTKIKGGSK